MCISQYIHRKVPKRLTPLLMITLSGQRLQKNNESTLNSNCSPRNLDNQPLKPVQKFSVFLSSAQQLFADDGQRERGNKKRSKPKMA